MGPSSLPPHTSCPISSYWLPGGLSSPFGEGGGGEALMGNGHPFLLLGGHLQVGAGVGQGSWTLRVGAPGRTRGAQSLAGVESWFWHHPAV